MKHPRSIYLSLCRELRIQPITNDYLNHNDFDVMSINNSKTFSLRNILLDKPTKSKRTLEAYKIFKDPDLRIMLEGLIFSYEIEDICKLKNYSREVIEAYIDFFFDISDYKNSFFSDLFKNLIKEPEIYSWFNKCLSLPFSEIRYWIESIEVERSSNDVLSSVKNQSLSVYNQHKTTFENYLKENFVRKDLERIPEKYMQLYSIGIKEKDMALKATRLLLQYDSILNKNTSNFLSEWKMILEKTSVDVYNPPEVESMTSDEKSFYDDINSQLDVFPSGALVSTDALEQAMKNVD